MLVTYTRGRPRGQHRALLRPDPAAGQVGAAVATLASYVLLAVLQYRGAQRFDRAPFEPHAWCSRCSSARRRCRSGALLDPGPVTLLIKLGRRSSLALALLFVTGVLGPMERAWLRELTGRS